MFLLTEFLPSSKTHSFLWGGVGWGGVGWDVNVHWHFHTHVMLRHCPFFCNFHTHTRDATPFFCNFHTHVMLRHCSFFCNFHTHVMLRHCSFFCNFHTHMMLRWGGVGWGGVGWDVNVHWHFHTHTRDATSLLVLLQVPHTRLATLRFLV